MSAEIPQNFVQRIVREQHETVFLRGPSGTVWNVQLKKAGGRFSFENGWQEFVEQHSLNENDVLVFRYDGASQFSVQIFDDTGCEREDTFYVMSLKNVNGSRERLAQGESEEDLVEIISPDGAHGYVPPKFHMNYESEGLRKAHFMRSLSLTGRENFLEHSSGRFLLDREHCAQSGESTNRVSISPFSSCISKSFKRMENKVAMFSSDGKNIGSIAHGSEARNFSSEVKNYSSYSLKRKVSDESDQHNELNNIRGPVHLRSLDFDVAEKDMQNNFLQNSQDEKFITQRGEQAITIAELPNVQYCSGTTYRKENKRIASSSKGETAQPSMSHDLVSARQASSSDQKMFSFPAAKKKPNGGPGRPAKWNGPKSQRGCLEILKSGQSGVTVKRSTYTRAFVSGRRPVTDDEKTRTKTAALAFQSVHPFFVVVMKATFVSRGFYMHIPLKFVKAHLPQQDAKFMLRTGDGREWQVSYLYKEGRSGFLGGWADFVFANNLEEGDACVFEFIKGGKDLAMDVTVFRVVEQITPLTKRYFVQNLKETPKLAFSR
ncbi:B3 domain-containing transcription factor VRN1-like isoform X2 [Nymphaea colorata]|uniref:B3 domain-containing transcription factor VRN1-like isoform X2 n=1 Tax=Nymphaea colorata TaxID=210225 RepID=UPI00129E420A|nr:B3 domain-containing transcription factor VRN1-like isoform X2 [Nymphaea colorata]